MPAQDATSLALAIRRRETSASAVMAATLTRIDERAELGAVCHLDKELAHRAAAHHDALVASRSRRAQTPFSGVPFLMKDLGNAAAGLPPGAGSTALRSRQLRQPADSMLAKRFRKAGLLPFGLTTTPEFGLSLASEPAGGPFARNPDDFGRTPGGSSGGAAAAVAAGLVAIAHATDAAGSIRVPAACCGLLGLKPTRGATPNGPSFGNHLMGLVGELVVARSVRDVQAAFDCCTGLSEGPFPDPDFDVFERDGEPLRIGILDHSGFAIGAEQLAAVESVAQTFIDAGNKIVPVRPSVLDHLARRAAGLARLVVSVSMAEWLDWLAIRDDEISPLAAAVAEEGRNVSATRLFATDRDGAILTHELWRVFDNVDVIVTPMLANTPPPIGSFPTDHSDVTIQFDRMQSFAPYAALANVSGFPALSIPHGRDSLGLALSAQLIGPMSGDKMLLDLAKILERDAPWKYSCDIAGHP